MKCQAVIAERDGSQRECGEPATYTAYEPPIPFCDDHLHACLEDGSPDECATMRKIEGAS